MTPERWNKVELLFHAAMGRPPAAREAFVVEACGQDEELRREVAALLDRSQSAIPPVRNDDATATVTLLEAGAQLGPYKLESLIGAGGMGRVFRALDTRLGRSVAIKVCEERFSERFEREARAIAQLNHPNICTLYDVGPNYLVMELVDGEALSVRLRRSALPFPQVLQFGAQIAAALAAAHAKGIVHRDLKPPNIMISKNGVKVLDFGLAKATRDDSITASNVVMGTPAYMAPEQREGRPTDTRTDLYALGLALAEMAAGKRLSSDHAPPPGLPPALSRIVARCLAPDPEERWQAASDVKAALELIEAPVEGAHTPAARSRRWMIAGSAVAAAVLAALAAAGGYWLRPVPPERTLRFSILPPQGTTFLSVNQAGPPALSPDGRTIAFVAKGSAGRQLWVRSVDAFDERPLAGTENASYPFWSPDGQWVGFFAPGSLKKVALTGGQPQVLAGSAGATLSLGTGGTWSPDGTILYPPTNSRLFRTAASGGQPPSPVTERNVALFDENHINPYFLPDGKRYLLEVRGGPELDYEVWLGSLDSNNRRLLLTGVTNAQYGRPRGKPPGQILFVRDGKLVAQTFDPDKSALGAEANTAAEQVAVSASGGVGDFSVSQNGVLAYRVVQPVTQEMVWIDRKGNVSGSLGDRAGNPRSNLRISPDGKSVAFTRRGPDTTDVWVQDLGGGAAFRFTLNGGRSPVWSHDGSQIAYARDNTVYRKPLHGAGAEQTIWTGPGIMALNDWSGDDRYLLFTRWDSATGRGLWLIPDPLNDSARHEPTLLEPNALHGQFAPATGPPRWVCFDQEVSSTRQVFVRMMPGEGSERRQISSDGGNGVRFRRDGRELYYVSGTNFVMVPLELTPSFRVGNPTSFPVPRGIRTAIAQYAQGYDASPDGARFLSTNPSADVTPEAIQIVVNWDIDLK